MRGSTPGGMLSTGSLGRTEEVGAMCSCASRGAYRKSVWKEIKECDTIFPHAVFSLGNSRRLCFWKDVWCREEAFFESFTYLFALVANKEALVADL